VSRLGHLVRPSEQGGLAIGVMAEEGGDDILERRLIQLSRT
jgi:hypothetical protein